MTDYEDLSERFQWPDYLVFSLMLAVSAVIGIIYGCFGKKQDTSEFLMAGKSMTTFPVAMSLIARYVCINNHTHYRIMCIINCICKRLSYIDIHVYIRCITKLFYSRCSVSCLLSPYWERLLKCTSLASYTGWLASPTYLWCPLPPICTSQYSISCR